MGVYQTKFLRRKRLGRVFFRIAMLVLAAEIAVAIYTVFVLFVL